MKGICRSCEEPIAPARLAALPNAAYCRDCQEEQETTSPIRRIGAHDSTGVVLVRGEVFEPAEIE